MNPSSQSDAAGTSPLVSVIIRTVNRPELAEALQSVASQTYQPVEVILVDALGKGLRAPSGKAGYPVIHVVSRGQPLGRSRAANAGLARGMGQYLMFLDDDDWIAPEHIAGLMNALAGDQALAAYCNVATVNRDGTTTGQVFDHDFDPVLLRRDNYIPIHAVLFHRSLVDQGCRFDEALDVYEDWDFWLQLTRLTSFIHVNDITAYYRLGGDSDTATSDPLSRFEPGHPLANAREHLLNKWRLVWNGRELNELLGLMDGQQLRLRADIARAEAAIGRLEDSIAEHRKINQERQQRIDQLNEALDYVKLSTQRQIEALDQELEAFAERERQARQAHWHLQRHIDELQSALDTIYRSKSWRLMGPLRRLGRFIDARVRFPLKQRVHFHRYGTRLEPEIPVSANLEAPASVPAAPPADPEILKARYKRKAQDNLEDFLRHSQGMNFPQSDAPRVSILLVLYNQAPLTLLCLESILQFAPMPFELVVIDNASSDESEAMMKKVRNITLVRNEENLGFVLAVNQGARLCRGKYTLLLNNDALLHRDSIEAAVKALEETPDAGAVGGRILLLDGSLQEAGSFIFSDGSCLGYGRHQAPESPEFMFRREVDYCSGAFLLFSTALFRDMGGFDTDYVPAYYEDSDFCVRLQEAGLKVIYEPAAVITHYEFASSGGQTKASELQTRHRAVLCRKHGDYLARRVSAHPDNLLGARTANSNINILMIDDRVPHAGLGSGFPRSRQIAHLLAGADANLTFYPLQFPRESWSDVYATLPNTVEVMLDHGRQKLVAFLRSRRDFYDYILVSRVHNMETLGTVLHADPDLLGRAVLVYDAEAITAPRTILQKELHGEKIDQATRQRWLAEEISMSKLARTVIAVSPQEAELYREQGVGKIVVLGHSLEAQPTPAAFAQRSNLLFVGALHVENSPNVDSLIWFVEQVLPGLRDTIADLQLLVVGDSSARSLEPLRQRPGVKFLGRVDDISPYYDACRVFIAPTRFAAGIPHKVHEAAAHGIPCVTTTLLAQQLNWQDQHELLAADTAGDFSRACLDLYRDASLWQLIRDNALAAVSRDCSPQGFADSLLTVFGLAGRHESQP